MSSTLQDTRAQRNAAHAPDIVNFRYWHLADIAAQPLDVRYWG